MKQTQSGQRDQYTQAAKWCHWLVAILMLSLMSEAAQFKWVPPEDRGSAIPFHVAIGLIILALTLVRLAVRKANPPPPLPRTTPAWTHGPAKIGHFLLYAVFLYMAVIGIWMAAISPVDIRVMSQFNLSALAPANPELLAVLRQWHFAGSVLMVAVVVGHICAALWHHFFLRDTVLSRMLPLSGFIGSVMAQGKIAPWRFPSTNNVDWHRKSTWFRDNS